MAKLSIVGTGLIGTSIALALKEANINDLDIVGTDYSRDSRIGAQKSGGFDKIENRLLNAVKDADIVILAVPVMAMEETMTYIASDLKEGCIVTDVGSTKRVIAEWAASILPQNVDYVGGHPMAGKETHGPENADANLFTDKVYCIIPSPSASKESVEQISKLAKAVKAEPYYISFNHFKTACIVHGVYARYMQGQKSTEGVDLDYYRTRIGVSIELSKQAASELS